MNPTEKRKVWTREETIVTLWLYFQLPFAGVNKNHPEVLKYASILQRSPSSVSMKIGNFGSFDPELLKDGIKGLTNTSKLDREIWNEFYNKWELLVITTDDILLRYAQSEESRIAVPENFKEGLERTVEVKQRVNQNFFRNMILASYNTTCCITGISLPELLIASHIIPWSQDNTHRLNPHNGLCLNALHDKAFDTGLITITPEYRIKVSEKLKDSYSLNSNWQDMFDIDNQNIKLPDRHKPDRDFLDYHFNNIFQR